MNDMICRKSMTRCLTPGMCSPHGGCKDPATDRLREVVEQQKALIASLRNDLQEAIAIDCDDDAKDACAEVERTGTPGSVIREMNDELADLRARLAERDDLLRDIKDAPGGSSFKRHIEAALSASAEPSAPVECDWEPLTSPGQVQLGDWLSFRVSGSHICARASLIIDPGTDREEIVYNVKKNHYFITSMAIDGTSTHKGVLVSKSTQEPTQ
jgi:hypothetical protein